MMKPNGYAMLVAAATLGLGSNAGADTPAVAPVAQHAAGCPNGAALRRATPSPYVLRVPWFGRTVTLPSPEVSRRSGPVNRFHRTGGR